MIMRTLYSNISNYFSNHIGNNRNISFDVLRGIAILCVIFTHLPGVSYRYNLILWWGYAFFINMAVPVFMILMGYCAVMSAEKHRLSPLQLYSPVNILRKLRRYFIPWLPIVLVEILCVLIASDTNYTIKSLFNFFIQGGTGPGSYYIPVLFQFVLIFPLLLLFRRKILLWSFIINSAFELSVCYFHIPAEFYRICILRYVFLIGCGMNMFYFPNIGCSKKFQLTVTFCGVIYLFYMTFSLDFGRSFPYWWSTGWLVGLYLYFPLQHLITNNSWQKIIPENMLNILAFLGIRSYHIFLMQIVYFSSMNYLYTMLKINPIIYLIVSLICAFPVCIIAGCLYYQLENTLNKSHKKTS